jgi:hypothetical protein
LFFLDCKVAIDRKAQIKDRYKIEEERAGGMVQVVKHLPSKCEALSSKPQYCQINK